MTATLTSTAVGAAQFTEARAPIPALGFIGRGYVVPNISITGEFSFFKLPDQALDNDQYSGKYYDFDLYGTVNFNNYVGAQVGYRSLRRVLQGEARHRGDDAEGVVHRRSRSVLEGF